METKNHILTNISNKDGENTEKSYKAWLMDVTINLFQKEDHRKLGYISLNKCMKIVKELKLNVKHMPCTTRGHLSLEEVLDVVIYTEKYGSYPRMLKRFFEGGCEKDMSIEFPELFVQLLQSRGDLPADSGNTLHFSDIQDIFR